MDNPVGERGLLRERFARALNTGPQDYSSGANRETRKSKRARCRRPRSLARSARDDVPRSTFTLREGRHRTRVCTNLAAWSISREVIGPRPVLPAGLCIAVSIVCTYVRGTSSYPSRCRGCRTSAKHSPTPTRPLKEGPFCAA